MEQCRGKPRFSANVMWCGQFACRALCRFSAIIEYTMSPLRHGSRDCLLPFSLFVRLSPFACGLFYALISYCSLYLERLFLSCLLVCLFSFFLYLCVVSFFLLPTVALFLSVPPFSVFFVSSGCNFVFIFCSFILPIFYLTTFCSLLNSVSAVTGLRAGRPGNDCSIPGYDRCLSACPTDQTPYPPRGTTKLWTNGCRKVPP